MALTKVTEVSLFAIASVTSNTATVGSGVDVSTYYAANARIRFGRGTGTALTVQPSIRLQATFKTSPTANEWTTLYTFKPGIGASIGSQAVTSGGTAGTNSVTMGANTNFAGRDFLFFHNGTIANSEWQWAQSISTNTFTLIDNLVNNQTSGNSAVIRNQSEEWNQFIDCTSLQKLRLVVDNSGTGQAIIVEAAFGAVSGL